MSLLYLIMYCLVCRHPPLGPPPGHIGRHRPGKAPGGLWDLVWALWGDLGPVGPSFGHFGGISGQFGVDFDTFYQFWGLTDRLFASFRGLAAYRLGKAPEPYFCHFWGLGPVLTGRLLFGGLRTQVYGQAPRLADTESLGTPPPGKDESLAED